MGTGVSSVAHYITGHEQARLDRVCYFYFFGVFLASKGSNFSELICLFYCGRLSVMTCNVTL